MGSFNPFNAGGNLFKDRSGEKNNSELESSNLQEVEEPRSGAWDNVKSSEIKDSCASVVYSRLPELGAFLLLLVVASQLTNATFRVLGIVVEFIAAVFFGIRWLRKAVFRQEVPLFSRRSGFIWLILSLVCAFGLLLVNLLTAQ